MVVKQTTLCELRALMKKSRRKIKDRGKCVPTLQNDQTPRELNRIIVEIQISAKFSYSPLGVLDNVIN